jgi:hypothetical protein
MDFWRFTMDFPTRFSDLPIPWQVTMLPHNLESVIILLGVLRQGFPLLPLSITHNNRPRCGPVAFSETMVIHGYHLVMTNITMENQRF